MDDLGSAANYEGVGVSHKALSSFKYSHIQNKLASSNLKQRMKKSLRQNYSKYRAESQKEHWPKSHKDK